MSVEVIDAGEKGEVLRENNKGNAKSKGKNKAANVTRNRGKIFTADEVDCLLSLVDKYKDIVECKVTDGKTWEEKRAQWEKIAKEFNACGFSGPRTFGCLQNKWNMLKGQSRKALSAERKSVKATGGGEYRTIRMTPQLQIVARICAEESMTGEQESPDNDTNVLPAHFMPNIQRSSPASLNPFQASCSSSALSSSRERDAIPPPRNILSSSRPTLSLASTSSQSSTPLEDHIVVQDDFSDDDEENDTIRQLILEEEYNDAHDMGEPESAHYVQVQAQVPAASNWSSYTPAMLRGPKSTALFPKETPRKRKNNHRSYDLHNENLETKKRIIAMQEKYYQSLIRLQEKDEEIKVKEIEYRRRALEMKEERHELKMSKIREFYDQKKNNEDKLYRLKLNCLLRESQKGNRGQENLPSGNNQ